MAQAHITNLRAKKQKKTKKRQCRPGIVPFKRGKIPVLSDSYPLILSHCRMFLFILKFPLNCTECMSLHGWFRATNPALLWPNSLAAAGMLFLRHLSTNTVCFGSEAPLLADHSYSWMNEISSLLSPSNHIDSSREGNLQACLSLFSPLAGPPRAASLRLDFSSGKDLRPVGMCFLCK